MSAEAAHLRERAVAAARLGQVADAAAMHDRAVALAPGDASILNSAGFFWSKQGQPGRAIDLLRRAMAADRALAEPLFNLCLILTGAGDAAEAHNLLADRESRFGKVARYWAIRAGVERALGRRRDAFDSYSRAVQLDPKNVKAAHGQARMALETGQPAVQLYQSVIDAQPGNAEALLGYAQALDADNRGVEAEELSEALVAQNPGLVDALEMLAQLRWARGEQSSFTDHYAIAVRQAPAPVTYASWSRMLAGVDRFAEAADVAAAARKQFANSEMFALVEAVQRGEAGDDAAADAIFATLSLDTSDRAMHEARHRLRLGDASGADRLCARLIDEEPDHVAAWAMRGLAWRLLDDPRSEWLHGQDQLIRTIALELESAELDQAVAYLDFLHDGSSIPLGQSVRAGTQTRGGLFDRHEPQARRIEQAFQHVVDTYRAGLPAHDDAHPLLRHRDEPWRIAGSWSIRLIDAGHHVPHIHPQGLISSAAYFAVPPSADHGSGQSGWLELGRPPASYRLDLGAAVTVEPRVGECTLFPSTLYHGTRAFPAGKRMSVAIDVNLERRG